MRVQECPAKMGNMAQNEGTAPIWNERWWAVSKPPLFFGAFISIHGKFRMTPRPTIASKSADSVQALQNFLEGGHVWQGGHRWHSFPWWSCKLTSWPPLRFNGTCWGYQLFSFHIPQLSWGHFQIIPNKSPAKDVKCAVSRGVWAGCSWFVISFGGHAPVFLVKDVIRSHFRSPLYLMETCSFGVMLYAKQTCSWHTCVYIYLQVCIYTLYIDDICIFIN